MKSLSFRMSMRNLNDCSAYAQLKADSRIVSLKCASYWSESFYLDSSMKTQVILSKRQRIEKSGEI